MTIRPAPSRLTSKVLAPPLLALAASIAPAVATVAPPLPEPAPLAGPSVAPRSAAAPSLVRRDSNGRLQRLDLPPGEAALALLPLDAPTKAKTNAILRERSALWDRLIKENLSTILALGSSQNEPAALLRHASALVLKAQPLLLRGSLDAELSLALPAEHRRTFDALVRDYFRAVADDGVYQENASPKPGNRVEATLAENGRLLAVEAERAFRRVIGNGEREFDELLAALQLRPEQETRIRTKVMEYIERTGFNPSKVDEALLVLSIIPLLDADQQARLAERIRKDDADAKAPAAAKPKPARPSPKNPAPKPDSKPDPQTDPMTGPR